MEENNNNENEDGKKIDTDEILKETTNTINEVKDQVKGSFKKDELKNSAKETTNFVAGMFKNPIEELKNIAEDRTNKNFILSILALSLILLVLNKKKDKNLVTIMSVVTAAKLPVVIASVISLLRLISTNVTTVTNPFSYLCTAISTVLIYFGAKFVLGEEDDKSFVKKFVLIEGVYYIAYIVFGLLGIYI